MGHTAEVLEISNTAIDQQQYTTRTQWFTAQWTRHAPGKQYFILKLEEVNIRIAIRAEYAGADDR